MTTPSPANPNRTLALVVSRYNEKVTSRLQEGALKTLAARGIPRDRVAIIDAPGAFELTALAAACAKSGAYDGVGVIGCLIHGETWHDRYIAQAVATGITQITIETGVPVAFGLVTAETPAHAEARSGGAKGNKGAEAAAALMDTIETQDHIARAIAEGRPAQVARLTSTLPQDKS